MADTEAVDDILQRYDILLEKNKLRMRQMRHECDINVRYQINRDLAKLDGEAVKLREELDAALDALWKSN